MAVPALSRLTEAVRDLVAQDRVGWSGAARSALVLELLEAEEAIRAAALHCTGEWDAMSAWAENGALTPASWLSHRAPLTTAAARELVRDARLVHGNQATAKALSTAEISTAHVNAAARAARYSTAVRMACDAAVTRVITKGASTILDLGRATPVVSAAQRKALAIRDGGCVDPGCTAPPEWCDAHHKWHWTQGGPTDLANLELRCRRHHIKAHREQQRGPPSLN